jgi:hypothetical protein
MRPGVDLLGADGKIWHWTYGRTRSTVRRKWDRDLTRSIYVPRLTAFWGACSVQEASLRQGVLTRCRPTSAPTRAWRSAGGVGIPIPPVLGAFERTA